MTPSLQKKIIFGGGSLLFLFGVIVIAAAILFGHDGGEDLLEAIKSGSTPKAQPMELRGRWLGMSISGTNSASARELRVPPSTPGVLVVEVSERKGLRATQAGVLAGDVITSVDGNKVRDLDDLYGVSRKTDVLGTVLLEVQRWGQPITLALPAINGAASGATQTPSTNASTGGGTAATPAAWTPTRSKVQFYCPKDKLILQHQGVQPHYRCPGCGGPVTSRPTRNWGWRRYGNVDTDNTP